MSRGEQESKKSRETKTPSKPADKKPSNVELNDTELDGVAGGLGEELVKSSREGTSKSGIS